MADTNDPSDAQKIRRDPLLDRSLIAGAGLLLALALWQFSLLVAEVKAMRMDLTSITTRMAVVEAARYGDTIRDIEGRVRALEQRRNP